MSSFFIKQNSLVKYYTYQILDDYLTKSKKGRHLLRHTLKSEMCNSSFTDQSCNACFNIRLECNTTLFCWS